MLDGNLLISTIEWVAEKFKDYFSPIVVLRCYESGVLLRLGKYKYNLKEGVNWKIPLMDEVHIVMKSIDTFHVQPVDITTIDNKQVSVEPIIKFDIIDPKKYLIDTNTADGNIHDVSRGIIADYLTDCEWEDIKKKTTLTAIKNALKKECDDMGVNIHKVYFGRIVTTKVYTVFKE
jgi:regulator of protease activity HflC (stomatin/prohibitin superfamily)